MASKQSSAVPSSTSPLQHQRAHQHHGHDDDCCAPPASHLPLENFVAPASSLYPSFISDSDLPSYDSYSDHSHMSRNDDFQGDSPYHTLLPSEGRGAVCAAC